MTSLIVSSIVSAVVGAGARHFGPAVWAVIVTKVKASWAKLIAKKQ